MGDLIIREFCIKIGRTFPLLFHFLQLTNECGNPFHIIKFEVSRLKLMIMLDLRPGPEIHSLFAGGFWPTTFLHLSFPSKFLRFFIIHGKGGGDGCVVMRPQFCALELVFDDRLSLTGTLTFRR